MTEIPIYQIDAFASRPFAGNPAAVCPLDEWLDDRLLQQIAAENNLSETAFCVPEGNDFRLRWFTPEAEVELCGHATLATAFVLLTRHGARSRKQVTFHTRSGALEVTREDELLVMDFPARKPDFAPAPPGLFDAMGRRPRHALKANYWLLVYDSEDEVRALKPDMEGLKRVGSPVIASAPGQEVDFVSRFFAPTVGVPEDPVTGSAHCILTPYWSQRLMKKKLRARQISRRGGEVHCEMAGDRVKLAGRCAFFMQGTIALAEPAAEERAPAFAK
jgi:predicted PhzF superfamily epimerase YddE/YHI9